MWLAYFLRTNFPASFDNFATVSNRFRNYSTEHRYRENKIKTNKKIKQFLTKNVNKLKIRNVLECHRFSGKNAILRQSIQYIKMTARVCRLLFVIIGF